MSVNKKLFELASKDDKVKAELSEATFKALFDLLKEKGFAEDAAEAVDTAMTKVAEAHGIKPEAMEELSEDELKAVAGGKGCICVFEGEGNFYGDGCHAECYCTTYGIGDFYPKGHCKCSFVGFGF